MKHGKAGWIEEIEDKLKDIKIEKVSTEEKDLVKTDSKFLMDHATEHLNDRKLKCNY